MGDAKRRKSILAGQDLDLFSAGTLTMMPKESASFHSDPDLAFKFCQQGIEEAYQNNEILLDWDFFDSIPRRISISGSHSIIKRAVDKVFDRYIPQVKMSMMRT
jgi:hypothetical protein